MMTFPVLNDHVLLISAEPRVDIDRTAEKIMDTCEL